MHRLLAFAVALGAAAAGHTQTIYRCGSAYSDEPCTGGKTVDIRPTEGAHSLSGQKRRSNEAILRQAHRDTAKALQPLTGITPEESERRREERRYQSNPRIRIER